ncbi:putative LRR receptor-like serine/threonine-protein kinase [Nymphaea thermarum]|nr:putative LRR receptor-like serine/threonine-protein kinase [Nymphaea thermarum]
MQVTEKCDVYSFGVLALEVVKGTHPGELLSSLSTQRGSSLLLKDMLDRRLPVPENSNAVDIVSVVRCALLCICSDPKMRPTMEYVSHWLSTRRLSPVQKNFDTISIGSLTNLVNEEI